MDGGCWDAATRERIEAALPAFLADQRWFGGKARVIRSARIRDAVELDAVEQSVPLTIWLTIVDVRYESGVDEVYVVPLQQAKGADGAWAELIDAAAQPAFWVALDDWIAADRTQRSPGGAWTARRYAAYSRPHGAADAGSRGAAVPRATARVLRAESSNSGAVVAERFLCKIFRKTAPGENPELEVSAALSDELRFPYVPALAGSVEYLADNGDRLAVAVLQEFLADSQDAWQFALSEFSRYMAAVMLAEADAEPTLHSFLASAALLGKRTGQMHAALASIVDRPAFAPEPFAPPDQRELLRSLQTHADHVLRALERRLSHLPDEPQRAARVVLSREPDILARLRDVVNRPLTGLRIRCHGDYHLGQVLYARGDFAIIDFEGEPMRSLAERRAKRTPLVDVAGMIRSFHYASHVGLNTFQSTLSTAETPSTPPSPPTGAAGGPNIGGENTGGENTGGANTGNRHGSVEVVFELLGQWARHWYRESAAAFLNAYRSEVAGAPFLPRSDDEFQSLLDVCLLEKSLYEVNYELNNRPDWIGIPLRGVLDATSPPTRDDSRRDA